MATDATIKIKAKDETAKAFRSAEAGLRKIGDVAASAQVAIAGLVGAASLGALIKMNLDAAASAKEMSDAIGVNVEDLTAWQYAVRGTQVSGEKMGDVLRDVSERMGELYATGSGEGADVMKRLNLDISEMIKLSPDQQLLKIAGALGQVKDHDEKVFLMESLASDSSQLLPLLEDNAAGFKKAREEAEQLGAIIDTETAKAAKDFKDDLDKLKVSGNSLAMELGTKALPALNNITGAMVDAAKESGILKALLVGVGGAFVEGLGLEGSHADAMEKAAEAAAKKKRHIQDLQSSLTSNTTLMEANEKSVKGLREQIEYLNTQGLGPTTMQGKALAEQLKLAEGNYHDSAEAVKKLRIELEQLNKENAKDPVVSKTKSGKDGESEEERLKREKREREIQALRDTQQAKYAQMIEGWAGEMELTYIHEAEKKALLDQYLASEAISAQQHEVAMTLIAQEGAEARKRITESEAKARRDLAYDMMSNLSSLMASESKSQFEIGKRASLSAAVIKGYEAITSSYAAGAKIGGPVLGSAFALTAGIATKAQIDQIRKQQFAGGGSITPTGGGGVSAGGGQPAVVPVPPALSSSRQEGSGNTTTITLVGNESSTYTYQQVENMIAGIRDALANGDAIIIPTGSRQVQELAQ